MPGYFLVREAGLEYPSGTSSLGSRRPTCASADGFKPIHLASKRNRDKPGYFLVREAGLEPARPEWTLEPESSESANSTTRAYSEKPPT